MNKLTSKRFPKATVLDGLPTFHGLYFQEPDQVLIVKNQKTILSGEVRGRRIILVNYTQSLLDNKSLPLQTERLYQSLFTELWRKGTLTSSSSPLCVSWNVVKGE